MKRLIRLVVLSLFSVSVVGAQGKPLTLKERAEKVRKNAVKGCSATDLEVLKANLISINATASSAAAIAIAANITASLANAAANEAHAATEELVGMEEDKQSK